MIIFTRGYAFAVATAQGATLAVQQTAGTAAGNSTAIGSTQADAPCETFGPRVLAVSPPLLHIQ